MSKDEETKELVVKKKRVAHNIIIKTSTELQKKAEGYFELCEEKKKHPSIAGLTLFLGYKSKVSLQDLKKRGLEYEDPISWAFLMIEDHLVDILLTSGKANTGAMFNLKQKEFGWVDKPEDIFGRGDTVRFVSYESNIKR